MTITLRSELDLTIACCRWPRSAESSDLVRRAAAAVTDWNLFFHLVERHRVTRLVHDGLAQARVELPSPINEKLRGRAMALAPRGLQMARESARVQSAFHDAGLPSLIIKGIAIGILAYGDPTMKESWDIDLLTSPDVLPEAHAVLLELGYELVDPGHLTFDQFTRFTQTSIEATYRHRESGVNVELHWRLAKNRQVLASVDVHSPSQVIRTAGLKLTTFSNDVLFAHLCVHGVNHSWARLKWLADFGAFVACFREVEIEGFCRRAFGAGAGRTPAASLLLSRRLLGTEIPTEFAPEFEKDPYSRILEANAVYHICRTAPDSTPVRQFGLQLFVLPGLAYFFEQVRLTWDRPVERARYGALFNVFRVPLWLVRRLKRAHSVHSHARAA